MRISDWSSDVCSSDLRITQLLVTRDPRLGIGRRERHLVEKARIGEQPQRLRHALGHRPALEHIGLRLQKPVEIGRASWRERVCQYVSSSVVAGSLKKTIQKKDPNGTCRCTSNGP